MSGPLQSELRAHTEGGIALAFSGGVDSTLLLAELADLRKASYFPLLAVYFHSTFQTEAEARHAWTLAEQYGVPFVQMDVDLLAVPGISCNPEDRCYRCKHRLFSELLALAKKRGLHVVMDGSNADDARTYRPGRRALQELGVVSPLAACGWSKAEVRARAASLSVPVAAKPSTPCLATRFPYGTELTAEAFERVAAAERMLRGCLGEAGNIRVRVHGATARLEVDPALMAAVVLNRDAITQKFKALHFGQVVLDLDGFRSGSMDAP